MNTKILLSDIEKYAITYHPVIKPNIIKDYSDNELPELVETCHATFLITGNSNDFVIKKDKNCFSERILGIRNKQIK